MTAIMLEIEPGKWIDCELYDYPREHCDRCGRPLLCSGYRDDALDESLCWGLTMSCGADDPPNVWSEREPTSKQRRLSERPKE